MLLRQLPRIQHQCGMPIRRNREKRVAIARAGEEDGSKGQLARLMFGLEWNQLGAGDEIAPIGGEGNQPARRLDRQWLARAQIPDMRLILVGPGEVLRIGRESWG